MDIKQIICAVIAILAFGALFVFTGTCDKENISLSTYAVCCIICLTVATGAIAIGRLDEIEDE